MHDFSYSPKTIFQIGRSLARICRWAGNNFYFHTVFQHSLTVALLVSPQLRLHAILHDSPEAWTCDRTSPFKVQSDRIQEENLLANIYKTFELTLPTAEEHAEIKKADKRAMIGEIWSGCGDDSLKEQYPDRDIKAEDLTMMTVVEWPIRRLLSTKDPGNMFERLFDSYRV